MTRVYSHYTPEGADNPEWKGKSTVTMLTELIADPEQPPQEKDRAVEILKWCAAKEKAAGRQTELDHAVTLMFCESDARAMWEFGWTVKATVGSDGIERQTVSPVESSAKIETLTPKPHPQPAPAGFEPAIPLPVILDPVQEAAVAGMNLDARFAPAAVEARVKALTEEAARLKALLAQEL